jgi:hypothetical protein
LIWAVKDEKIPAEEAPAGEIDIQGIIGSGKTSV